ncbi:MAG TPA: FdtA/QdtA family cupin domain-containing protein [Jatrophihabitans sp.]
MTASPVTPFPGLSAPPRLVGDSPRLVPDGTVGSDNPLSRSGTIELPVVADPRGNLTFIETGNHIPFAIERVYYLYDVPGGASRGGHAHRGLEQLIIAMSGSFDIVLDDGFERRIHSLNRSYKGLYVPPMVWREIDNFSSGSVCLVLASAAYDESDYYRDYEEFAADAEFRLAAGA